MSKQLRLGAVCCALLMCAVLPAHALNEALLIGNQAYPGATDGNQWSPLTTPLNDVKALGARLEVMGFHARVVENLTRRQMEVELSDFIKRSENSDQVLLYFAGHGTQVKGESYLLGIDSSAGTSARLGIQLTALQLTRDVLDRLRTINGSKVVIVDACRQTAMDHGFDAGLATPDANRGLPPNTTVIYAAAPGQVAYDAAPGGSANGYMMQGLLSGLEASNVLLGEVLVKTADRVKSLSNGNQTPASFTSSVGMTNTFIFGPASARGFRAASAAIVQPSQSKAPSAKLEPAQSSVGLAVELDTQNSSSKNQIYRVLGTWLGKNGRKDTSTYWVVAKDNQGDVWPQTRGRVAPDGGCRLVDKGFNCEKLVVATTSMYPLQFFVVEMTAEAVNVYLRRRDKSGLFFYDENTISGANRVSNICTADVGSISCASH